MQTTKLKNILEAVLLGADRTLTVNQMESLFELDEERPTRDEIRKALHEMAEDYEPRGFELKQVASGFRLQVKQEYATWVGRLWEERPARYTRALLETMALIAYRQPVTRGEIEEVRGVSVSSNIIKTLLERDWIKVLGHKDVPGKPSLYGTTKEFLDYFNLKSLDQLPTLADIKDLDSINPELALDDDQNDAEKSKQEDEQDSNQENNPENGEEGSQNYNQENDQPEDELSEDVTSKDKRSIDAVATADTAQGSSESGEMNGNQVDDESEVEESVAEDAIVKEQAEVVTDTSPDEDTTPESSEKFATAEDSTADDLDNDARDDEMETLAEQEKQVFNV
jgi:segregation and condensation protein B